MSTSSVLYSIPYLFVLTIFLVCAVWEYQKDNNKSIIHFVCAFTFLIFFGLRGFVGWDWSQYYPTYQALEPLWGDPASNFLGGDVGYIAYSTLIRSITSNYHVFIFISVLIDVIILNAVLKRYSVNYALSFAVFMVVSLGMEIDTLRNVKSIMIFLLSLKYIEERKPWKYFALLSIAVLFHTSAVFFLPLYFFLCKKTSLKIFIAIFLIGNIIYLFQVPFIKPIVLGISNYIVGGRLGGMLEMYLGSELYASARGITISYLERFLTAILVMCYYNKLLKQKSSNVMFVNLFIIYITVALFMSEMNIILARVGALFVVSYWIIWPALADCFALKNNQRLYLASVILASYMFVAVRSMSVLYYYDNFLFGTMDYQERIDIFDEYGQDLLEK